MAAPPVLVILAAGASRRLGECKALVRLREEEPATPLALLLAGGEALDDHPPLVVTGRHHMEIAAALPAGVEVLHNPDWAAGRTGGIRRAARRLAGRDLCLAPVDVPAVPRRVFAALRRAWEEAGAPPEGWLAPWTATATGPRHGHPVVVGRDLAARLEDWEPDRPLRDLRNRARPLLEVETDSASILLDLDGPTDLERIRTAFRAGDFD